MVTAVRAGTSMRSVAREHDVSLSTVQWWVRRAEGVPLERVDWGDRRPIPRTIHRTERAVEDVVLALRRELKETSDLGEYGARAIQRELVARTPPAVPSVRTISRILDRRGALDGARRIRRMPPPRGWYLQEVAQGRAELDSFDIVEGLALEGGIRLEVLNVVSLHGGLPGSWPQSLVTAHTAVDGLLQHWREFGLPAYAQFDNDTIFQGSHHGRDSLGRVVRTCLRLGVTPVFAPPQESGFQAAIEAFNGRWQVKVWARFHHDSLADLQRRSRRYLVAYRTRAASRIEAAPTRRPFPTSWHQDLQAHPDGVVIFIRRTSEAGVVNLLSRTFDVDPLWPHRLLRCEVDLRGDQIRFYALRRREPTHHSLLRESPYHFPRRPFHE
jgi:transposase-like protein